MAFSLTYAPAIFQALANDALHDMLNRFLFVYIEYILIFTETLDQHVKHVRLVLQWLFAKAEKCKFHASSVTFLGFGVHQGKLALDPAKVRAVVYWQTPAPQMQLPLFGGFANFYRQLSRNYSKVTAGHLTLAC